MPKGMKSLSNVEGNNEAYDSTYLKKGDLTHGAWLIQHMQQTVPVYTGMI